MNNDYGSLVYSTEISAAKQKRNKRMIQRTTVHKATLTVRAIRGDTARPALELDARTILRNYQLLYSVCTHRMVYIYIVLIGREDSERLRRLDSA